MASLGLGRWFPGRSGGLPALSEPASYHSRFGGLWIDRADWRQEMARRRLSNQDTARVSQFVRDGYTILEGAASLDAVDAFQREVERSFRDGNPSLLYQKYGDHGHSPLDKPVERLGTRIVDAFVALPQALDLFTSPALLRFLTTIFGEPPLLFHSLSFDQGSQQGLHQDTAYVVVNRPLELAACWIALEDIQEGSGELMYAPGSHRLPDWDFGSGLKHWNPESDAAEVHHNWGVFLQEQAKTGPRGVETFLAKKGDILIWHADLAHGGSPVVRPELTRQSLVGHFCPRSARPNWFDAGVGRDAILKYGDLAYSSQHYDLRHRPAAEPERTDPPGCQGSGVQA